MSTSPSADADLLARRYGRRPAAPRTGRRYLLPALAVVGVLTGTALAAWLGFSGQGPVSWQDGKVTPLDDTRTRFAFTVTAQPGTRVVCAVRVLNAGRADVGRLDVWAGPATERSFAVTALVPTSERGAGATVRSCVVAPAAGPATPTGGWWDSPSATPGRP